MAHLSSSYSSFSNFLDRADSFWKVDFTALNSSGVSGTAILAMNVEEDGTRYLNVAIGAEGLTPDQVHAQHIHGLFDEDGNPIDSVAPTLASDMDGDGLVEVLEGVPSYGDVLLSLISDGQMPSATADGEVSFVQSYDLGDGSNFFSPVTGTDYDSEDIMPLELREIVLHGVQVPDGLGEGTGGEVDGGSNGYIGILPAAAGSIEIASEAEARLLFEEQLGLASDRVVLGDGADAYAAGLGNDEVFGNAGNDTISGGADDDSIYGNQGDDQVFGNAGNDLVRGGFGNDLAAGGDGDDEVHGWAGNDTLYGGSGNDTLVGESEDDQVFGETGDDLVYGSRGNDLVGGGEGNDSVFGNLGDDAVYGGQGDDVVGGGAGRDAVAGGTGNDRLEAGADGNAANAADAGASGALSLSDYDNGYAGDAGDDLINGGDGDDIITGDADSRVSAATGTTFDAMADGADTIYGGAGNDEIHTGSWADSDDGFGNTQTGEIGDEAYGGDGDDILRGAGGDDRLFGDDGNDDIGGGGGDDLIVGGAGDDTMSGNAGKDIFGGLSGNDVLTGGEGADEFHFDAGTGTDRITDFTQGEDVISLLDDGAISFANSTTNEIRGSSDLSAMDFDTVMALSELDAANDQQVVYSSGGASELSTGTGAAVAAYVAATDGTDGFLYFDDDWSDMAGRELITTLDGMSSAMTVSDFDVY